MSRRHVMHGLFLLWLFGMAWSAWSIFGMAPTGDGLVRGFNKIFGFMVGQAGAGACAVLLLILGWKTADRREKWLARTPAIVSLLVALVIAGLIVKSRQMQMEQAHTGQPTKPVSAPAEPTQTPAAD